MQINRAIADGAAAGHGDSGLSTGCQQGAKHADTCSHGPNDVISGVGCGCIDRADRAVAVLAGDLASEFSEQFDHVSDVGEGRNVAECDFAGRENGCCHGWQGRILRSIHLQGP